MIYVPETLLGYTKISCLNDDFIVILNCWFVGLSPEINFTKIEKNAFSTIRFFSLYYENYIIIIIPVDIVLIVIG